MRWSRIIGLVAAIIIAVIALGSVAQLGESLFDHGGMIPTLVVVAAFVVIAWRLGNSGEGPAATPYW